MPVYRNYLLIVLLFQTYVDCCLCVKTNWKMCTKIIKMPPPQNGEQLSNVMVKFSAASWMIWHQWKQFKLLLDVVRNVQFSLMYVEKMKLWCLAHLSFIFRNWKVAIKWHVSNVIAISVGIVCENYQRRIPTDIFTIRQVNASINYLKVPMP